MADAVEQGAKFPLSAAVGGDEALELARLARELARQGALDGFGQLTAQRLQPGGARTHQFRARPRPAGQAAGAQVAQLLVAVEERNADVVLFPRAAAQRANGLRVARVNHQFGP